MVQRGQGIAAQDRHAQVIGLFADSLTSPGTGQVAHRAGDDCDLVAALTQVPCQFMMAGAAGLIQRSECLVDQQNMHIVNILLEY